MLSSKIPSLASLFTGPCMAMIMCLIFGLHVLFIFLKARSQDATPTSLLSLIVGTLSLDYKQYIFTVPN